MKCVICKTGETHEGVTTIMRERQGSILVIKEVPAEICKQCGERYFSEEVTDRILKLAKEAFDKNIEMQVMHYAA